MNFKILPWPNLTLVVLIFTFLAMEVGDAVADGLTLFHKAKCAVLARRVVAYLNVFLTIRAGKSHSTNTRICCQFVNADASVQTWGAFAFVNFDTAEASLPPRRTIACEVESTSLHALTPVVAFISTSCYGNKNRTDIRDMCEYKYLII